MSSKATHKGRNGPSERISRLSARAGALVALLGGGHLLAWLSGVMTYRGFSTITMKTNTSLAMFLSGVALVLVNPEAPGEARRRGARLCAGIVLAVGVLTLSEHVVGWDLGIDQLLAQEPPGSMGTTDPNRMGPPAAVIYTLAGVSLLLLSRPGKRGALTAQGLALGICLVALLGTMGYLYGVQGLYALEKVTAIAWPTAAGLLILGVGLLCARPDTGWMIPVTAQDPGGVILRRLLIPALLLPVGLGGARLAGENRGLYDTAMGTALLVLAFIILFSLLIYLAGSRLSRSATAESAASDALRESEERFRTLFTGMTEGFALGEPIVSEEGAPCDFRFLEINAAFERQSGLSRDIVGKPASVALPQLEEFWIETYCGVALKGNPVRFEQFNRDTNRHYDVFCYRPAQNRFAIIFRDVTEDRKTREALRRANAENERQLAQLNALFSQMTEGLVVFDPQGNLLDMNPAALEIHGFDTPESLRRHLHELTDVFEIFDLEGHPLPPEKWPIGRVLKGEVIRDYEVRVRRRDTGKAWIASYGGTPVTDRNGEVLLSIVTLRDISAFKEAQDELLQAEKEIRQLNAELEERVERRTAELQASNKDLEAFSYTVSHDLRAPLRHIAGFVELLKTDAGPGLSDQGRRYLGIISEATRRMGTMIDDLLAFSRLGRAAVQEVPVDMGLLVYEARQELAPEAEGRNIDWRILPLPEVHGDPVLLRAVVVNLLSNAIKYTRHRDPAQIEFGFHQGTDEVVFYVRDNGAGFDPRFADRLFGVFQRLHPEAQFEGTGIGLASVRRIIERHKGRSWAEGEVDRGATFYFSLPI